MCDRPGHKQVWTKVNAPVDEGVASLVEALSAFEGLQTTESCQDVGGAAWVCFYVGTRECGDDFADWKPVSRLALGVLGRALTSELGDLVEVSVRVTEVGWMQGELTVRLDALDDTVSLLHQLATRSTSSATPAIGLGAAPTGPLRCGKTT